MDKEQRWGIMERAEAYRVDATNGMCVSPDNLYVEALLPNVTVFGGEAFER